VLGFDSSDTVAAEFDVIQMEVCQGYTGNGCSAAGTDIGGGVCGEL
jgi:hypothetical protein